MLYNPSVSKTLRLLTTGILALGFLNGCSLSDLVSGNALPPDLRDPNIIKNHDGAVGAYYNALNNLAYTFGFSSGPVAVSAYFTDEASVKLPMDASYPITAQMLIDSRLLLENDFSDVGKNNAQTVKFLFQQLQNIRVNTREGIGALKKYAPDAPNSMTGHLYAIEAFSQVLLAEFFCSGIPLTMLNFESGYTPTRAFTTAEVYQNSLYLLDTALALSVDSTRITHFVNLVRARVYLNIGDYKSAALAISQVPTTYQYILTYSTASPTDFANAPIVGDYKGQNGLPFRTSHDARITTITNTTGDIVTSKLGSVAPISISTGVEARLIEAEDKLHRGDINGWLKLLNDLRTTGVFSVTPDPVNPLIIDTVWTQGSGAILFMGQSPSFPGLRPLSDPGSDSARVSLLFRERAYWLYLTGHRQGDLRRLVRNYQRPEYVVYPSGPWGAKGFVSYGTIVNLPTPVEEQERNRLYHGCINRDA